MKETKKTLKRTCLPLALGLATAAVSQCSMFAQTVLDPAWRVSGVDTNKPGFLFNYFSNNDPNNTGNSIARAENDLAGLATDSTGALLDNLGDPTVIAGTDGIPIALKPAAPANPPSGVLSFEITNVINLSKFDGTSKGNFVPDLQMPGVSGANSTDGQAAEIFAYLNLPVGTNFIGVNSDDGFQATAGPNPQDAFGRVVLGQYEGGRGASDTIFPVVVQQAGIYPIRVVWENGGGDANVEFFSVLDGYDGINYGTNIVLVNDLVNGGIPAYRAIIGGVKPPYVKVVSPGTAPRQLEGVSSTVSVVLADGTTAVDDNSVALTIDGKAQTLTKTRSGGTLSVGTPAASVLQLASESHTGLLTFKDISGQYTRTQQWTFYNLENLILPDQPVTGENFDSYPEATSPATAAPPGWVLTNFTWLELGASGFGANGGNVWDLTAQANDPYVNWCMIDTNTAASMEKEILQNNTAQTINGIPVTTQWMSGNCLFAASDSRARHCSAGGASLPNDYAPQIQIAISAPFNLSSVTNPVLTWSSGSRLSGNHEQNALEYSVDNGTNWLPGMILQNSATVFVNLDGSYDAVKMLTNVWADVARFPVVQDPTTRDFISAGPLGQKFGDVLAAPITQAWAPFVANRNDGAVARKVEAIRLPAASKKSAVRLRFSHYGSCGWEWAIDNIAFYDIAPAGGQATPAPVISSINATAGSVTVKWTNGGTLYSAPSVSGSTWTTTGNNSGTFTEPVSGTAKFYRVIR